MPTVTLLSRLMLHRAPAAPPPAAAGRRGLVPAYQVLNASVRLPVRSASRAMLATVAVKNVLNRAYITDRQEGIMTGAPRSLVVGFELAR